MKTFIAGIRSSIIIIILMSFSQISPAQILEEYNTAYSGSWTELETEGSVFYTMDVTNKKCRIYKPNYQLWKTVNISVPNNNWLTDIQYVSQHLFNSDDKVEMLIVYYEYVQTSTSYYYIYTTRVVDEQGMVLLNMPKGSYSLIYNTKDAGSKLMVYETDYSVYPYPVTTHVYSIPGVWMGLENEQIINPQPELGNAWPNPSAGNFSLNYSIPGQPRESWFILYNMEGTEILREPLSPENDQVNVSRPDLPSGQYLYRIVTPNYQSKGQKITISK